MSLNSEKIFVGVEHADARSLLYATGHLQENIGRKPLIGVVNTFNEIVPGHFHLRGIADAAKQGVLMAGGVPVEFPAIAICDGITMAHKGMMYPLPSRELIADSIADIAEDDGFVDLSDLGNLLIKKQPDFDPRNYGFGKLSNMLRSLPRFEVVVRTTPDPNVKPIFIRDVDA